MNLPPLARILQALGFAAKPPLEGPLQQILLVCLFKQISDHFLRQVAIDAHRQQLGQNTPRTVTPDPSFGPRNRSRRAAIVERVVLNETINRR
jgi:hypothetical protein